MSADNFYLFFFCCSDSFTFSRISCCSDTLPDCNKCKWYFFCSLFLKRWFERTATRTQCAEVNTAQQSRYLQVCPKCWQRHVTNSLHIFSFRKKLRIRWSGPDLSIITAYAWKGRRLCPSEGYNCVCPSELYGRNRQHVKTRCWCQCCLQPAEHRTACAAVGEGLSGEHLHLWRLSSVGHFYRVKIVLKTRSKNTNTTVN